MKFLKFILWPILFLSLVWVSAIFLGPTIIVSVTSYFSEGQINLTRVKISPKLKISVAAVDLAFPRAVYGHDIAGTLRGLTVEWSMKNGFELAGLIGSSKLKWLGDLSPTTFTFKPASVLDWSEVDLRIAFDQIKAPNFDVLGGELSGRLSNSFQGLKDAELTLSEIRGNVGKNLVEAEAVKFNLDNYNVAEQLFQQNSAVTYSLKKVMLPLSDFEGSSIVGDVTLFSGEMIFKLLMEDAYLMGKQLKAKNVDLTLKRMISDDTFEGNWKFSVSEFELNDPLVKVQDYSGTLAATTSGISHIGRAANLSVELKSDDYFIGQIEKGILDVSFTTSFYPSGIDVSGQGVLTLRDVDDFSANLSTKFSFPELSSLNCFDQNCKLGFLEADYHVAASEYSLQGSINCVSSDCFERPSKHVLKTDNTNGFFQSLSEFGILSPLSSTMAYMAISNGEALGYGHILDF